MSEQSLTVQEHKSVLLDMSTRFGMDADSFEATLRATVFPKEGSKEQLAAFLLVAKEYELNPLTKEIYAFPGKGGGIQPIVSVDGWANLINSHPAMDGLEFDDHLDNHGNLTAITARIWRKDRSKPTTVTEYLEECRRVNDVWKTWPRRMLRHKAMIQCARYAFGFAGIVDPDEAERIGIDVSFTRPIERRPPSPSQPQFRQLTQAETPAPVDDPSLDIPKELQRNGNGNNSREKSSADPVKTMTTTQDVRDAGIAEKVAMCANIKALSNYFHTLSSDDQGSYRDLFAARRAELERT